MGALAASLGAPLALTIGAGVALCYSAALSIGGRTIRDYERGK
jgi:hypothetical protein